MKKNKLLALLSLSVITAPAVADCISDSSLLEATSKTTLAIHPLFLSHLSYFLAFVMTTTRHAKMVGAAHSKQYFLEVAQQIALA